MTQHLKNLPRHVAIIMDGNGRWARERGLPRIEGHRRGAESVREIVRVSGELGIDYLTLYAFSIENWNRPKAEVSGLMRLLEFYLKQEIAELDKNNVRLAAIHAFFRYVGAHHPDYMERAQRVLGVPFKRADQRVIEYLDRSEIEAVLTRVDRSTTDGRRDYALLTTMFNTGARVQEVIDLRANDLQLTRIERTRPANALRYEGGLDRSRTNLGALELPTTWIFT